MEREGKKRRRIGCAVVRSVAGAWAWAWWVTSQQDSFAADRVWLVLFSDCDNDNEQKETRKRKTTRQEKREKEIGKREAGEGQPWPLIKGFWMMSRYNIDCLQSRGTPGARDHCMTQQVPVLGRFLLPRVS